MSDFGTFLLYIVGAVLIFGTLIVGGVALAGCIHRAAKGPKGK